MSEQKLDSTEGIPRIESPGYLSFSKNTVLGMIGTAIGGAIAATFTASMYTNGQRRTMLALPILWNAFSGAQSIYPWARGQAVSNPQSQHVSSQTTTTYVALVAHSNPLQDSAETDTIDPGHSQDAHVGKSGQSHLYAHQTYDSLTASKTGWLNPTLFLTRLLVYFTTWSLIAGFYFQHSKHQDNAGGVSDTGIMSRHVKGNHNAMIFWTVWMLVMHYVDLYWLVMPEFRSSLAFGLPEVGTLAFVGGCYVIGASYISTRIALLPIGDPRLKDSLAISDAY